MPEICQNFIPGSEQLKLAKSYSVLSDFSALSNNECSICNKKFLKNAHLLRHVNEKHSSNRSYECKQPGCGKKFKRDSHLKRHMISHTHQKLFKCDRCIMAFGYKHHLDRHLKSVHQKSLLVCQQCELNFIKKKSYFKHVQKVHSHVSGKKNDKTNHKKGKRLNQYQRDQQNSQNTIKKTKKITKNRVKQKQALQSAELRMQEQLFIPMQQLINRNDCPPGSKESQQISQSQSRRCNLVSVIKWQNNLQQNNQQKIFKDSEKNQQQRKLCQKSEEKPSQELLFRCIFSECVSAFKHMPELTRHISQKHQQFVFDCYNNSIFLNKPTSRAQFTN